MIGRHFLPFVLYRTTLLTFLGIIGLVYIAATFWALGEMNRSNSFDFQSADSLSMPFIAWSAGAVLVGSDAIIAFGITSGVIAVARRLFGPRTNARQSHRRPDEPPEMVMAGIPIGPRRPSPLVARAIPPREE